MPRRNTGGLFESDAKAVAAFIAAHAGDDFDLVIGLREDFSGAFETDALKFLTRSTAKAFGKRFVKAAARHRRDINQVFHADGFMTMIEHEPQTSGDTLMVNRQQVTAAAG